MIKSRQPCTAMPKRAVLYDQVKASMYSHAKESSLSKEIVDLVKPTSYLKQFATDSFIQGMGNRNQLLPCLWKAKDQLFTTCTPFFKLKDVGEEANMRLSPSIRNSLHHRTK